MTNQNDTVNYGASEAFAAFLENVAAVEVAVNPHNAKTGKAYEGRNAQTLAMFKAGKSGKYATFLQWKELGRMVKKGEHGVTIVKFIETMKKAELAPGVVVGKRSVGGPRFYTVFALEQTFEMAEVQPKEGRAA